MTIEEVIKADTASIAPAYPLVIPAGAPDECIVYQIVSAPETQMNKYVSPRVQLGCWAKSYGAAVALANEVRDLYWGRHVTVSGLHYRSMVIDSRDGVPDLDAGLFSRQLDIRFEYRNA